MLRRVVFLTKTCGIVARRWLSAQPNKTKLVLSTIGFGTGVSFCAGSTILCDVDFPDLAYRAQAMYEQQKHPQAIYDVLKPIIHETNDPEILWRHARAAHDLALHQNDKTQQKELMYEAFHASERALVRGDDSFAVHKWYAIMLSAIGDYEGSKKAILNAFKIKDHFSKAIELNPTDATSRHLLGIWCWTFADMPWYQKKAAAAIFASPPESSYQEALDHFLEAERLEPRFYTKNCLYLAKCYLALGDKSQASSWKSICLEMPANNPDDEEAHQLAKKLRC